MNVKTPMWVMAGMLAGALVGTVSVEAASAGSAPRPASAGRAKVAVQTGAARPAVAASTPARGAILSQVHAALQALVSDGTISQAQADAVQREADHGAIEPWTLIAHHTLTVAQMRVVGDRIDHVKSHYDHP